MVLICIFFTLHKNGQFFIFFHILLAICTFFFQNGYAFYALFFIGFFYFYLYGEFFKYLDMSSLSIMSCKTISFELPFLIVPFDDQMSMQCGRPGFDPWVRQIPWRRKWQPTPVLLPGKFHGEKIHGIAKSRTWLNNFTSDFDGQSFSIFIWSHLSLF